MARSAFLCAKALSRSILQQQQVPHCHLPPQPAPRRTPQPPALPQSPGSSTAALARGWAGGDGDATVHRKVVMGIWGPGPHPAPPAPAPSRHARRRCPLEGLVPPVASQLPDAVHPDPGRCNPMLATVIQMAPGCPLSPTVHQAAVPPPCQHPQGPPVLWGEAPEGTCSASVPCSGCLLVLVPPWGQPTVPVHGGPQ